MFLDFSYNVLFKYILVMYFMIIIMDNNYNNIHRAFLRIVFKKKCIIAFQFNIFLTSIRVFPNRLTH